VDEYLTVAEVAETLKLNQQTVRNWIDQGRLPALRLGRRVRIRREDFRALTEEGYMSAAATPRGFDAAAFWDGEPFPPPAWATET
jgi:excisionase family DNA binding protein